MKFPPLRLKEAMTLGGLSVKEVALRTWAKMGDHEIMTRAAAVAFYAMLALVPFLALVLTVTLDLLPDLTRSTGERGIGNLSAAELDSAMRGTLPEDGYEVVHDQIVNMQKEKRHHTSLALILVGLPVTIWLASSLFVAIIDAMNRIYGVADNRSYFKIRLVAIAMTCLEAAILVGSLLAIVLWPLIVTQLGMSAPAALVATAVQWLVILIVVLLSFALAFYIGPDADQRWEWITPGSIIGSVVFLVASLGFRMYVQHFADYGKTYGSLGGVMVLLFWFWISALVLLTSAQVNKIIEEASPLGKNYGQKIDPTEGPDLKSLAPEANAAKSTATAG